MADLDIAGMIRDAANQYGVPPDFALSVAQQESGLDPGAVSPKGAIGVFQLMPDTAASLGVNPRDVQQNIVGGVKYLKALSDRYGGDRRLTAAAYNAGPGAVDAHGGVPPYKETQDYVKSVAGADNLPDPQAVLQAYGLGGQPQTVAAPVAVAAAPLPNVPGYVTDPSYKPPAGEGANPAYQAPAIPLGGLPSPDEVAKAYNFKLPDAGAGVATDDNGVIGYLKSNIVDAPGRAYGRLASDVSRMRQESDARLQNPQAPGPVGFARDAAHSLLDTARLVRDAGMIPLAPIGGAVNAFVVKPAAAALTVIPGTTQAGNEKMVSTALMGLGPEAGVGGDVVGSADAVRTAASATPTVQAPVTTAPAAPVNALAAKVAAFDRAGVTPTLAAIGGKGAAVIAKASAENPVAGARARTALSQSIADTANSADTVAQGYGTPLPRASAGEAAQAAIQDYVNGTGAQLPPDLARQLSSRDISFGDKASALYTRAERLIGDTQQIAVPNTIQAIQDVMGTFQSPALAQRFRNSVLAGIGDDLAATGGQISWRDAKMLRTSIRERLMGDPQLSGTVSDAQVGSIYQALTQDMRDGSAQLGGPQAAHAWDQANTFYQVGKQQIDNQLTKVFAAPSGEAAYDSIMRAAGSKGGADIQRLLAAKRAIGDGWGDVAATAAQRLGTDQNGVFSVNRFVTNYANLSDAGRSALFGSLGGGGAKATQLKAQLDNLAEVAAMQKNVEQSANHSNTMISGQAAATIGGLATHPIPTLGVLGGLALSGEAMTNPLVVRWLAGLQRAVRTPGAFAKATRALQSAASNNRALVPLATQVAALRSAASAPSATMSAAAQPASQSNPGP